MFIFFKYLFIEHSRGWPVQMNGILDSHQNPKLTKYKLTDTPHKLLNEQYNQKTNAQKCFLSQSRRYAHFRGHACQMAFSLSRHCSFGGCSLTSSQKHGTWPEVFCLSPESACIHFVKEKCSRLNTKHMAKFSHCGISFLD